jgi:glyceraldehyde-3-phosphate dehydrogenase (NADP+)
MFEKICQGKVYKNLLDGEWYQPRNGYTSKIFSPSSGELIGEVQANNKSQVDEVIKSSIIAQMNWAKIPISEKADILHKAASIMEKNIDALSSILQKEIAKDKDSAISEIKRTADFIRFTADEGKHLEGETIGAECYPGFKKNKISFVTRVPLGVVLAISPFNYPINLSASKIAPALMAGNSVILKPPSQGAISALHLCEIFNSAGLPGGVLNTITGKSSEIGDYLVTHSGINFLNFTGSTVVGKHIAEIIGMVPMLLELGGKDAAIVLSDADLDEAAKDIVSGAFSYSGQRCTAVKRVLAMKDIADALVEKLHIQIKNLTIGMPESGATITPLIDTAGADFVQELIDDTLKKGGKLIVGNHREGNLMHPTLFDYVTTDMRLAWEEPFGPVLPVLRVTSLDEAIDIANCSKYGLQSSVFTKDIDAAFYVASRLEVGTVQINNKTERGPDHFPFLGVKSSGMGTQGIRYSIEAMSRPKAIVLNIN